MWQNFQITRFHFLLKYIHNQLVDYIYILDILLGMAGLLNTAGRYLHWLTSSSKIIS